MSTNEAGSLAINQNINMSNGVDILREFFVNPDFTQIYTIEEPDSLGRLSRNKSYAIYSSPLWQDGVYLYAARSLVSQNQAQVDLAIKAIEFGFSQQLSNGDFAFVPIPDIPVDLQAADDVGYDGHSGNTGDAFFLAAVGSTLEAFQESVWFQTSPNAQAFRDRLERLKPKIQKALDCLATEKFSAIESDTKATNRIWFYALAFYGCGKFIGDAKYQQIGLQFAQKALSQYDPSTGIFLENGGGDSAYQVIDLINASQFSFLLPQDDPLLSQIQQTVIGGAMWLQSKILPSGEISTAGNTRVYPGGETYLGQEKELDYKSAILGLSYAGLFSYQKAILDSAQKVTDFSLPGILSFSAPTFTIKEDGSSIGVITVNRTFGHKGVVTATLSMASGGTASSSDYNNTPILITFADGDDTSKTIRLPVSNDTMYEGNETLNLRLSLATGGARIGVQSTAITTILDDDPLPTVSITSPSVSLAEGNQGTVKVPVTIQLSNTSYQTITVPYSTVDHSTNIVISQGTLTFTPGQSIKTIEVRVAGDSTYELNQTLGVQLGTPTNARLGTITTSTVTVLNDDPLPTVSITSPSVSLAEENQGAVKVPVTVQLSNTSYQTITVPYSTVDHSTNTVINQGNLTFTPGQSIKTIEVRVAGDSTYELNQTLGVQLGVPTNARLGTTTTSTVTVLNDDPLPTVSITSPSVSLAEGNQGAVKVPVTVQLSNTSYQTITVPYSTVDHSTNTVINQGNLTFTPGQSIKTIEVRVAGDSIYEPNQSFGVQLGTPTNARLGTTTASVVKLVESQVGTGSLLLGGNGQDLLIAGLHPDTLTGGQGSDTFQFFNLSDSLLNGFDQITDLQIGTDIIRGPSTVLKGSVKFLGAAPSLDSTDLAKLLTPTNLLPNQAGSLTSGAGSSIRTFLLFNDQVSGFSATTDSIVEISGYSGDLHALGIG